MNWSWSTLAAVREGRVPKPKWECSLKTLETGAVEVFLKNSGEANGRPPKAVRVFWEKARLVAGDGVQGFEFTTNSNSVEFHFRAQSYGTEFRPGQQKPIGWLTIDTPAKLQIEIQNEPEDLDF